MKIYFAGSIRGGRDDAEIYVQIIKFLQNFGEVLTEHVGSDELMDKGESHISDKDIHDRDMKWLIESDIIIAEVTNPSLGVGYEIGRAIELNKKIICLHRTKTGKRLSAMIAGSENLNIIEYENFNSLKQQLEILITSK